MAALVQIIALTTLVLAAGQALPRRISITEPQIVGGDETTIESFPYQVAMSYMGSFRCGGSIISDRFVLTAAHCLYGLRYSSKPLQLRAGSTFRSRAGQLVDSSALLIEPRFTMSKLEFDVGLIKLASALRFSNAVRPIGLVAVGTEPRHGETITLSGWGVAKEDDNAAPDMLRTVKVKVVPRWLCSVPYLLQVHVTDAMICASAHGKDACQGDSGGPAVNDAGEQVGIVSFGNGCAHWPFPGAYTNLGHTEVRQFIDKGLATM